MKQKILLLVIAGGLISLKSITQPVITDQKVLGGTGYDEVRCILKTKDQGLITGGVTWSNKSGQKTQNTRGGSDYWAVKTNQQGKIEWDKTIGGNGDDNFKSLIETSDGGCALIGESNSYISVEKDEDSRGDFDYWIVKLDKKGNIEWDKTIGGSGPEYIDNMVQTGDGGYILAGSSLSDISGEKTENSRGGFDYWVVKLDKNGNKVWDKSIGGNDWEFCSPVILTKDGGVLVGGFSWSNRSGEKSEDSRGDADYWVVKLDKTGKIEWDKTIGGEAGDFCHAMVQRDNGNYLLAGTSISNIAGEKTENSRGGFDYWLAELDKSGNKIWDKTIGGDNNDNNVWSILQTEDKGFILEGWSGSDASGEKTEPSRGGTDYWVVKLDKNLQIQWDKTIGGSDFETVWGTCVQEIKKNIYVVGGTSPSGISGDKTIASVGDADFWFVTLDASNVPAVPVSSNNKSAITAKPNNNNGLFTVYPNPARDKVYVHTDGKATLVLTSQGGKQILTQTISNTGTINLSNLTPGIYYLKNNESGKTQKIMIAK